MDTVQKEVFPTARDFLSLPITLALTATVFVFINQKSSRFPYSSLETI